MLSELMVNFGDPVSLTTVANTAHRAAMAIGSLVTTNGLLITGSGYSCPVADMLHRLSHWADQAILLLVIMKRIITESFYSFFLFLIEVVILDVSFNLFFL